MRKPIHAYELTPATRRKLGIKTPRSSQFSKDQVRTWALKVLAAIADLKQDQRRRVLDHALRVNRL
ncbi:MAG: hypothetical protein ACREJC_07675 [Tepidisphaeraceae bacterium]